MSTATLPPVNALALLAKNDITKTQLKEVHETIAKQLNDSNVRRDIRRELENMGNSVVAMDADFAKVYAYVENIDSLGVVLDKNNQVIRFAPEWKLMHDEYTSLMDISQETATVLSSKIQDLLDIFSPFVYSNASAVKKEIKLNEYISELEEFVKIGTSNANRFLKLREDIGAFQKKLHDSIPNQITDIKEQLKKVDADIQKLEGELKELAKFLGESWYDAGASDGLSVVVNLAPKATLPIIAKIFSCLGSTTMEETISKGEEKERKEIELKGLKKQKGDLNAQRLHIETALVELNALDATFADLIGRLTTMQTIWRMLVNDAIKFKEGLVKVDKPAGSKGSADDEDEEAFVALRMNSLKVVYFTLQDALETYVLSVAP